MAEMQWFASLGVGGILAGVIFWFYRTDRMEARGQWTSIIDRMDKRDEERLKMYREEAIETRGVLRTLTDAINRSGKIG